MTETYELSDARHSKYLACLSIALTAAFLVVFSFGYELCRTGFPLKWFVIGAPILGVLSGIEALFNPKSSIAVVVGKWLLVVLNLCCLSLASIALVGMRIAIKF